MTRDEFEALMVGSTEPGEDLDLVVALGRLARARQPGLALVAALGEEEGDLEDPGAEEEALRFAAAHRPRRPLPARYEGAGSVVELRAGLGGLPEIALLAGPPTLEIELDPARVPLTLGEPVLVPWVEEPPETLTAHRATETWILVLV